MLLLVLTYMRGAGYLDVNPTLLARDPSRTPRSVLYEQVLLVGVPKNEQITWNKPGHLAAA